MERLGSTCSYGHNDSRSKIWSYTFYHFRSYSTWKKAAISVHCMMEIHHRIFHRFFSLNKRDQKQQSNSRDSWEAGEAAGEWKFFVFIALSGNQKRWPLCTKKWTIALTDFRQLVQTGKQALFSSVPALPSSGATRYYKMYRSAMGYGIPLWLTLQKKFKYKMLGSTSFIVEFLLHLFAIIAKPGTFKEINWSK